MHVHSFEPIIDGKCRVLVLGTMPGIVSLKKRQYYGHERNAFWRIVYALFGKEPDDDYDLRKQFLLAHNIALWDVLRECERESSSDGDIRNPVPNDFSLLYRNYPGIRIVCFNGGPAGTLYARLVEKPGLCPGDKTFYRLPSTSPKYAVPFEKKLEEWRLLLELLEKGEAGVRQFGGHFPGGQSSC